MKIYVGKIIHFIHFMFFQAKAKKFEHPKTKSKHRKFNGNTARKSLSLNYIHERNV